MKIHEIYSALFLGKTVKLKLPTAQEANNFRVQLAKYKKTQDDALDSVGMGESPTTLSCKYDDKRELMTIAFVPKRTKGGKEYFAIVIDEEPMPDGNCSGTLGGPAAS